MFVRALLTVALAALALLCACAAQPMGPAEPKAHLPLLRGWYDGRVVYYVTTDVSVAEVAQAKGANFAPRLSSALARTPAQPGQGAAVDKVYGVTNFAQDSIFASAPAPVGARSASAAYSPLWQLVKVTWRAGAAARLLKSEEDVLQAQESGLVSLETTPVVLNCPIIQVGGQGALPGVAIDALGH